MSKKKAKAAPAADKNAPTAARKRSKLKIALLAAVPLLLAGGGYAGWTFFAAPAEELAEESVHGIDPHKVAALKAESAPESTFTYALALAEFLKKDCGAVRVDALKAKSEAEAEADGVLAHKSWMAAARRFETVTAVSCSRVMSEVFRAEDRAASVGGGEGEAHAAKANAGH